MRRWFSVLGALAAAWMWIGVGVSSASAQVLRVGSFDGIPGQFNTIQVAVDAARPGDWILVGPRDYKTSAIRTPRGAGASPSAVLITTKDITLRGMNRKTVIVDGTKSGAPCSSRRADQSFGPPASGGPTGLNGIVVWKADNVAIENLTACNFLGGSSGDEVTGNEIWWSGGANGRIGGWGYHGSYLSATSMFYDGEATAAHYGLYSGNWSGGTWDYVYASNFNDSGLYIGACQQLCNQQIDHGWAENNAIGYAGTNSGGWMVIQNSQFDNNEDGFDTNSQNDDLPPPQDGACPNGGISPITHTHSCWVFMHNYVHDNNNPNVPTAGYSAAGPVGTGLSVSGARNDTIMDNTFVRNGAWGTIFVPYPDSGPPCTGGTNLPNLCLYDEYGDALLNNRYSDNGFFGNPTNGDFAAGNLESDPTDCFSGNTDTSGTLTSSPSDAETAYPTCNGKDATDPNPQFLAQVSCDSNSISIGGIAGSSSCPPGANYPRQTRVSVRSLPSGLRTMPHVCSGVPANPWCSGEVTRVKACVAQSFRASLTLPVRERFVSITVTAGSMTRENRAHGRKAFVFVNLGDRQRAWVRFLERIKVRGHSERVTLTRVYHVC